jgi:hypothetical protein
VDGAETKVLFLLTKGGILEVFGFCGFFFGESLEVSFLFHIFAAYNKEAAIMSTLAMIQLICKLGVL